MLGPLTVILKHIFILIRFVLRGHFCEKHNSNLRWCRIYRMAIVHTAAFLSSSLDSNTCKTPPEYSLHSLFSNPLSEGGPELVVFLS